MLRIIFTVLKNPTIIGVGCCIIGLVIPPAFPIMEPIAVLCLLIIFFKKQMHRLKRK